MKVFAILTTDNIEVSGQKAKLYFQLIFFITNILHKNADEHLRFGKRIDTVHYYVSDFFKFNQK